MRATQSARSHRPRADISGWQAAVLCMRLPITARLDKTYIGPQADADTFAASACSRPDVGVLAWNMHHGCAIVHNIVTQ